MFCLYLIGKKSLPFLFSAFQGGTELSPGLFSVYRGYSKKENLNLKELCYYNGNISLLRSWTKLLVLTSLKENIQCRLLSTNSYESVDLIAFLFNIEANKKFYHRHIIDISESRASLTGG